MSNIARRKRLSDKQIRDLKPRKARYAVPDPECLGHYVRVMSSGAKSFAAIARDPYGKQIWATIGAADHMTIEDARERAREIIKRVKAGKPAIEPAPTKPDSFEAVAKNWLKRYVEKKELISQPEIKRCLDKYVYPYWRNRPFVEIQRSDVAHLLDHIEDKHGARQADLVLAMVRKITNWFATRSDTYVSPVVRGMGRAKPAARDRILSDDEIRVVWGQAEANGTFGAIIRLALLTAQRREKLMAMRRADIVDGVWTVPSEERQKGVGGELVLPKIARRIIDEQPQVEGNPFVFAATGGGGGHFNGMSKCKLRFDKGLPPIPHWTLHDLRRTARSLMSRAGVPSDHAERVLGHTIKGVEGVYNHYDFRAEKADALRRLAGLIETVINPPAENVLPIRARG
jgi:integrase